MGEIDYDRFQETRERLNAAELVGEYAKACGMPPIAVCLHGPGATCRACAPDSPVTQLLADIARRP